MRRGHEFLLAHRLFRSHRTGEVVNAAIARMNFPPRWHYDFIRALDHLRSVNASGDERMQDAIELLLKKRKEDGRWPASGAAILVTALSLGLWALILVGARWLTG